jgi:4'-phosphopantetheinyl transferase
MSPIPDPGPAPLIDNAVQVWVLGHAAVEGACAALGHALSPDERQRAAAYRQAPHRQRFIARRGMLRWLLGRYLGCEPASLVFGPGGFGKPVLHWPAAPRLGFSVSQAEGMALLAFARDCSVGVDVEQVAGGIDIAGVAREVFSPAEMRLLDAAGPDAAAAFFSTWSRKEALLKAVGTGLAGQPCSYTTGEDGLPGQGRWRAWHNGVALAGWTFLDLDAGRHARAALAVSLQAAQVSVRHCA